MGDKRNFAALEWVVGEIGETLKEARQALEAYVEDPKDSTRIRFCLTHIHQVHGSLQMVEFHGAALLAEEMEQLAQAIMNNAVSSVSEAQEVLMRSLLQLPIFLDHVKSHKDDNPIKVLPLLNDLRAVRKQHYLSESNMFSPDLSSLNNTDGKRHPVLADTEKLKQVIKKLREMYQFAAASVLKDIKVDENLGYVEKVFGRLEVLSNGTPSHPLWQVASALVDGLRRDDIELSVAVRGLLRYLARELRILGDKAPQALELPPREGLLKNLLYYIARADKGSDKIAAIKKRYNLGQSLLNASGSNDENADHSGVFHNPDPEAIRSVVVALQDEMTNIKHLLDLSMTNQGSGNELKEVLPAVKRVADTLAVLGIGDLRKQMIEQSERLESISEANSIDEQELMHAASKIIEIEHRLEAIGKSVGKSRDLAGIDERKVEIDEAKATVIKECRHGLEKAKEAIVEYISSQWDKSHLENVGELLTNIRGGLEMIPLRRPATIVSACGSYIQDRLMDGETHPAWNTLDSLADAMASVEYYLERLIVDLNEDHEGLLEVAEDSVRSLDYAPSTEQLLSPAEHVGRPVEDEDLNVASDSYGFDIKEVSEHKGAAESSFSSSNDLIDNEASTAPNDTAVDAVDSSPEAPLGFDSADSGLSSDTRDEMTEDLVSDEPSSLPSEPVSDFAPEDSVGDRYGFDGSAENSLISSDSESPESEGASLASDALAEEASVVVDEPEIESDIDDEIIEIFIEEAGEVLDTLREYFPQWQKDMSDHDALVVVRRAFHTLKGSGRMVEAFDIGELAWSVENMLNRMIDRTIKASPAIGYLIDAVIALAPSMVSAFEQRKRNPRPDLAEQYASLAAELSEGNLPSILEQPLPPIGNDVPGAAETASSVAGDEVSSAVDVEADDTLDDDDYILREIFSSEALSHLAVIEHFIADMDEAAPIYSTPSDDLQRALHTLKGSAKMAQVWPIAEMAEPLEHFAKELITYQVPVNDDILQLIRDIVTYTKLGVSAIEEHRTIDIPKLSQFIARAGELRELAVGHLVRLKELEIKGQVKVDPRLLSIFMAEEMTLLLDADELLDRWQAANSDEAAEPDRGNVRNQVSDLVSELTTLEEGARQANLNDMADLSAALKEIHERAMADVYPVTDEVISELRSGHEALLDMVDAVAAGQNVVPPPVSVMQSLAELALREAVEESDTEDATEEPASDIYTFEYGGAIGEFNREELAPSANQGPDDQVSEETVEDSDTFVPSDDANLSAGDSENLSGTEHAEYQEAVAGNDESVESSEDLESLEVKEANEGLENTPAEDVSESTEEQTLAVDEYVEDSEAQELDTAGDDLSDTDSRDISAEDETVLSSGNIDLDDVTTGGTLDSDVSALENADEGADQGVEADVEVSIDESPDLEEISYDSLDTADLPLSPSELNLSEADEEDEDAMLERNVGHFLVDDIDTDAIAEADADADLDIDGEGFEDGFNESADEIDLPVLDDTGSGQHEAEQTEVNETEAQDSSDDDTASLDDALFEAFPEAEELELDSESVEFGEDDSSEIVSESAEETVLTQEGQVLEEQPVVSSNEGSGAEVIPEQPIADEGVEVAPGVVSIPGLIDAIDTNDEDFDSDILEVFLEEADELSEELDEAIHSWESDWTNSESVEAIKRALHTFKGGARLSGLNNMGELAHDYESYLIGVDLSEIDDKFFGEIHRFQDKILSSVRAVHSFVDQGLEVAQIDDGSAEASEPEALSSEASETLVTDEHASENSLEDTEPAIDEPLKDEPIATEESSASNVLPFAPKNKVIPLESEPTPPAEFVMPSVSGGQQAASVAFKKSGPQEVVKVPAELLEELVNLAGETSISRSRLEQQVSDFSFSLDEVDSTLSRLQEQLRRLDIETEAQIIFRQEQLEAHEDFDPLEMDRYSQLQQLSRSLIESASDLVDLKSDLGGKLRDTETLLLQQSRINTNLQEGLMRSRMVPFSRLVPRLRRIVRQVAAELGKNVSFELDNIEGELDRSVLERMVPPFEHMLRNAVDHGIESPEERIESGKAESGRIVLTLGREGGDVIIRLADDGRGIDLKRVRDKAIERELMSADAELSDHDIMQFILHAGFSTADAVTQISGRGVGMDVVSAEIKQLGGAVMINSSWGKGTEFVVRLPFTLSVNRALMVEIGQDHYAVPLSSIEGIVRVSPFELEHYYSNSEARFEYANENYHVRYLGGLLNRTGKPKLEGQSLPLPVLLVRSAEHTMALQVDGLLGSREIVVKSLGQQFSTVTGLSGATVMGDGSVVVILDPHALVRQEIARATLQLENDVADALPGAADESFAGTKTVMVVDDSVTVRKVTTRFLEREGFNVTTAKDGVDALRMLQDELPDLMLLDIEMPRMDGFEVAKTIRTTKRWEHLPIIMITSRTGDKHREHALTLGVNKYLGKPYQEDVLLESMDELFEEIRAKH